MKTRLPVVRCSCAKNIPSKFITAEHSFLITESPSHSSSLEQSQDNGVINRVLRSWHLCSFRRSSNNNPDSSVHDRNITGEPVINTRLHYIKVSRVSLAKKLQLRWQVMDRETSFHLDFAWHLSTVGFYCSGLLMDDSLYFTGLNLAFQSYQVFRLIQ